MDNPESIVSIASFKKEAIETLDRIEKMLVDLVEVQLLQLLGMSPFGDKEIEESTRKGINGDYSGSDAKPEV